MTGTQLSFSDFAQAQMHVAPTKKERAEFYREAFKEREKKNAFSFSLDLSESMFSLLWEHYDGNLAGDTDCWEMASEVAGVIIGRGCETKNASPSEYQSQNRSSGQVH